MRGAESKGRNLLQDLHITPLAQWLMQVLNSRFNALIIYLRALRVKPRGAFPTRVIASTQPM
jgi:hypothetical protein